MRFRVDWCATWRGIGRGCGLQCVAVFCSVLQWHMGWGKMLREIITGTQLIKAGMQKYLRQTTCVQRCAATHCNTLKHSATLCRTLRHRDTATPDERCPARVKLGAVKISVHKNRFRIKNTRELKLVVFFLSVFFVYLSIHSSTHPAKDYFHRTN